MGGGKPYMTCSICGDTFGTYGWPAHVAKEKRIHGKDCYIHAREKEREENVLSSLVSAEGPEHGNKRLTQYIGDNDG